MVVNGSKITRNKQHTCGNWGKPNMEGILKNMLHCICPSYLFLRKQPLKSLYSVRLNFST